MRETSLARFAEFAIRRRKMLLWGTSLVALGLTVFTVRNEFHDDFSHYFGKKTEIRQDNDFIEGNLTGVYQIHYSLGSGETGGIGGPNYLRKLEEFAQWYRRQPGVLHVFTLTDIIKRLNKNMHGDDPSHYRIPEERTLAAQYLLLYELSLPFGLDLNDRINVAKSATRMTVTLKSIPTKEVLLLEERAQKWLKENVPPAMAARGSGVTMMFSHIGRRNTQAVLSGDVLGVLLMSLVMVVALKSVKFGLITMAPNLLPAGMSFGLWGILVGRIGMDAAPVTSMTLGILVDDTTHNIGKYMYARRGKGLSPPDAIRYTFSTVGMATLATTLILVAGFSVLAFSSFKFNSTMGLLSALTILIGGLAEFSLMPALLLKMEEKKI